MSMRKLLDLVAILALCLAAFVVQKSNAAGLPATGCYGLNTLSATMPVISAHSAMSNMVASQ
ncbi:MAG: hypothetical protein JSV45_14140 [Chromatiales bacterium]|nr:MAG: hypothetical protein JSV45_14140 [Chromatiales bacterium]